MLHALAAAAWLPAAPGRQAMWCGARQLRLGSALPLRPRLCSSPQMQASGAREAHTGSAASASVDALVDELSEVVATHARSPLALGELHRSLQTLTAKAAEALKGKAKTETVAIQPVIVRHPATGEPAIFVNPYTTSHILGLPEAESEDLIEMLTDVMEDQAFRWEHVWSPGDTLMWDNRGGLMHSGRMDYPRDQARRFIRTTVRGNELIPFKLSA